MQVSRHKLGKEEQNQLRAACSLPSASERGQLGYKQSQKCKASTVQVGSELRSTATHVTYVKHSGSGSSGKTILDRGIMIQGSNHKLGSQRDNMVARDSKGQLLNAREALSSRMRGSTPSWPLL